jgi:hypothetical protein
MCYNVVFVVAFKLLLLAVRPTSGHKLINPNKTMKNLSKTILAVLATGVLSCALFSQQAQATPINGMINLGGSAHFDTNSLATATRVITWINTHVEAGSTGDFAGIPINTPVAMAAPWIFNPSTPRPGLWSVAGFTFDLLSSSVLVQNAFALVITGTGIVSGNGFDPTNADWSFAVTSSNGNTRARFSFQASGNAAGVPDGGSTIAFVGIALIAIEVLRRKLRA